MSLIQTYWSSYFTHSQFPFLNPTADELPSQTEKSKVLHYFKACYKNEPVANIMMAMSNFIILSHIPENFQGVAEMIFDRLPKSSRVDFVADLSKENSIKFFWRNNVEHQTAFDLRPEDLRTKGCKGSMANDAKKSGLSNVCLTNCRNLNVC